MTDLHVNEALPARPLNPDEKNNAKTKALAALRQAAWEATQWLDTSEVVNYVDGVMLEVESDAP